MTDAYNGRDSRRSNAPIGNLRRELIRATRANELKLSGSPIQYFTDPDYQNADYLTTGTYKMGIAGLYDHTATAWLDPDVVVTSVSTDGYTIILSAGVAVDDLIEVYYYATGTGWRDAETASQVGDPRTSETFDAMVQKLNDCPPLDWENNSPAMVYDISMGRSTTIPLDNATTSVIKYAPVQIGTWQTTDTPFYVTGIFFGISGLTVYGAPRPNNIDITIDGTNSFDCGGWFHQGSTTPANPGVAGFDGSFFIHLGLIECRSDFEVEITWTALGNDPTAWETNVAGWHS
jgi:hypothetical protein